MKKSAKWVGNVSAAVKIGSVAAVATASNNAIASTGGILGGGIGWGDVGEFALDLFTPGGVNSLGNSDMMPQNFQVKTPSFSANSYSFSGINFLSSDAEGGYLLYPNKPNNNQMLSVYSK
jgi:hypothetical protein